MIEKLNMQLDSTLMFFPSYTHVFAASCSHKDSTPKIQEARVTAFFFFDGKYLTSFRKLKTRYIMCTRMCH